MSVRIQCLCIDTTDPSVLATFWEQALGWRRTFDQPDEVCIEPAEGSREDGVVPDLLFLQVQGPATAKCRFQRRPARAGTPAASRLSIWATGL